MHYRMIAIDLDRTLLNRDGQVSEPNLAAIRRARAAGVMIVPCTGRAWREARLVMAGLELDGPGVFVTGAAVSDIATGRTLDLSVMDRHLAMQLVQRLRQLPEAVLVFRDSEMAGHDYLVTGQGELSANTEWWFQMTGATVHFQRDVGADDLHHTLRVGIVAGASRMMEVTADLRRSMGDRVFMHSFEAIQMPDPDLSVHILEVFAPGVDKWRGIDWIARQRGLAVGEVAAIGDEINDVAMLASAGCGIAMANAVPAARDAARYVTGDCDDHGVAAAIGRLMSGDWR